MPKNMTPKYPQRNVIYTTAQVYALDLRDQPFLRFPIDTNIEDVSGTAILQDTGDSDVVEKLPGLRFVFLRETEEWIPLFKVVSEERERFHLFDFHLNETVGSNGLYFVSLFMKGDTIPDDYYEEPSEELIHKRKLLAEWVEKTKTKYVK